MAESLVTELQSFTFPSRVTGVMYIEESEELLVVQQNIAADVMELSTGRKLETWRRPEKELEAETQFSRMAPDFGVRQFATGDADGRIAIWRIGDKLGSLDQGHAGVITALAYTRDDETLISAGADKLIKIWDARRMDVQFVLSGNKGVTTSAVCSRDGRTVFTVSAEDGIQAWDIGSGRRAGLIPGVRSHALAISQDGGYLTDGATIWSPSSRSVIAQLKVSGQVTAVAFSPRGTHVAVADATSKINLFSIHSWRLVASIPAHEKPSTQLTFDPTGSRLAAVSQGNVKVWDTRNLSIRARIDSEVRSRLARWMQAGDLETRKAYKNRMEKTDQFINEEFDRSFARHIEDVRDQSELSSYESDDEEYTIGLPMFGYIEASVPLTDAAAFKKGFRHLSVTRINVSERGDDWRLRGLVIEVPGAETSVVVGDPREEEDYQGGAALSMGELVVGWKRGAEEGDPDMQAKLALAVQRGYLVETSAADAGKLARAAAGAESALGHFCEGQFHYAGFGRRANAKAAEDAFARSADALEEAAKKGDPESQLCYAWLSLNGMGGIRQSDSKAKSYAGKAAGAGYPPAMYFLGNMYLLGNGVAKDSTRAAEYFRHAARAGEPRGMFSYAHMYEEGSGVAADAEIALEWYGKAARAGYTRAIARYGETLFRAGKHTEAQVWLEKGALKGDARAQYVLGVMLVSKKSGDQILRGMNWVSTAIRSGYQDVDGVAASLDRQTGLGILSKLKSEKDLFAPANLEIEKQVVRGIAGFRGGVKGGGISMVKDAVAKDPESLYLQDFWFAVHQNGLPIELSSELYVAVKNKHEHDPYYWATYGQCAILAGQPGLALLAANRLSAVAVDPQLKEPAKYTGVLMRCVAQSMMGQTESAYTELFKTKFPDEYQSHLVNYISRWAPILLRDRNKLVLTTLVPSARWPDRVGVFNPPVQAFHNVASGKLIAPVSAPKTFKGDDPDAAENKRKFEGGLLLD